MDILDFLTYSLNLKNVHRQGWIDKLSIKNPESVFLIILIQWQLWP